MFFELGEEIFRIMLKALVVGVKDVGRKIFCVVGNEIYSVYQKALAL